MNFTNRILVLAAAAATLAACDPKAPVASSDIDAKIAAHASDPNTHANLIVQAANINGTFDGSKITAGTVTTTELADNAVTDVKIVDGSITPTKLAANSVTGNAIAPNAVGPSAIAANAVQTAAIGDLMVTTGKLAANAVDNTKLAANAVLSGNIMDGQVANADLANASVDSNKLAANAVANGNIANAAVDSNKLAANAVATGNIANAAVDINKLAANSVDTGKIVDGTIATADVADYAINDQKITFGGQGRSTNIAFTTFASFETDNNWTNNTTVTAYVVCGAEGAADGNVRVLESGTVINTAGASAVCPNGKADLPGGTNTPFMFKVTFSTSKMKRYDIQIQAGAANSAVVWRHVHFTY